jgi:nucleoside-diphosphate-sugar epimerase
MKILLTGASGFTGRHFQDRAALQGHTVMPLAVDLTDAAGLKAEVAAADADAVVHLAAISFVAHANLRAFYEVNVIGTTQLLDAVAAAPRRPACVLVASSANIYGNADASPIAETQPPAPVNHYAMSKLAMEHMARTYGDRLPLLFTRPFNYTGVGQAPHFVIPKLVDHFARRAATISLGNLHVEREFNDVRMVCDAYLRLLERGTPGEAYNICTGQPHTLHAVIDRLGALAGHTMEVRQDPAFTRANEVHRLCGDPRKLRAAVGELPEPPLEETLAWMLAAASAVAAGNAAAGPA